MPTAVQALAEVHDTLLSEAWLGFCGLGVGWMDHEVPSHRSAKVRLPVPKSPANPTAVQALADVHDTPDSPLFWSPAGLGVGWMDHEVPFHRSASVTTLPALFRYFPTAVQASAAVHDTLAR